MTHYNIDVVSDMVCPWCYVGKKRLDLAIKQHQAANPSDTFTTNWHAFQLNPDAPKSIDKQEFYASKFGAQRTHIMQGHLARLGRQIGINFAFGGRTGNTLDSHRLVQLGRTKGPVFENRLIEQMFTAYFETNEDITSQDVLVRCAVRAGLDEAETRAWLQSDQGGAEVEQEILMAQEKFISGVPNFTINGKYEVQGAEESAAFLQVFNEIKDMDESDHRKMNGAISC